MLHTECKRITVSIQWSAFVPHRRCRCTHAAIPLAGNNDDYDDDDGDGDDDSLVARVSTYIFVSDPL